MKQMEKELKIIKNWTDPNWVKAKSTLNQEDLNKYLNKWLLSNGLDDEQQRKLNYTGLTDYEMFELSKITGLKTNNYFGNCEIEDNQNYILANGFKAWWEECLDNHKYQVVGSIIFNQEQKIRPSLSKLLEEIFESDKWNYEQIKKHLLTLQNLPRCKKYLDKKWSDYMYVKPLDLVPPDPDPKQVLELKLWPGGKEWGGYWK